MESDKRQFDIIVIGAGINGAGIARDAAMRGLKVLLLDKGDIGSGTSSWSTRLIHGGLRYLEHGEFGLVRESLRERECLMRIAPHLVRPLRTLVPIYKDARRGMWTIRAGLTAYDLLSFDKTLPHHEMLSAKETVQVASGLNREGLIGAAIYFDTQVEFAERLVLENALAAIAHGATVITHARVERLLVEDGQIRGVEFIRVQSPELNNQSQSTAETAQGSSAAGLNRSVFRENGHSATASIVINAAGPWIDQVLEAGPGKSPRLIGGTKGSHLIVAPFAGAPETAVYVEAETDGRPFFIIPWNGKYLIGTTDLRYEGDLDQVQIDNEEVAYLLRETNRVVPSAHLSREHILYTYSGVRPLPFTGDKDEQSITRRHFIRSHPNTENLFSIVGGKLTTYRSLAEEAVDSIVPKLRRKSTPCRTDRDALPGAATPDFEAFSKDFTQRCGLPEEACGRLLRIYGTRCWAIADLILQDPSRAEVFDPETGAIEAEVIFSFKYELAQTLSDCLLRRTMVGLNSSCGLDAAERAAGIAHKHLGWSESRARHEVAAYENDIARLLRQRVKELT